MIGSPNSLIFSPINFDYSLSIFVWLKLSISKILSPRKAADGYPRKGKCSQGFSLWLDGDLAEGRVIRSLKPRGQNWFSIVTPVLYPGGGMPVMPN